MAQPQVYVNPRRLFPVENDTDYREWCGPSVLCALSNHPMSTVRRVIKDVRENWGSLRPLMGMSNSEMVEAAERLGFTLHRKRVYKREDAPTVARWLRQCREDRSATYILVITYRQWVTGHYVIVRGNKFADSHTGGPVNLKKCPHRRKRVKRVFRVWQKGKRRQTLAPIQFKL